MIQVWGVGGAIKLFVLMAVAIAVPLVFGTAERALWDWSLPFITLVFVVLPALSLVHLILTPFAAASFRGGRRLAEAGSMLVPLAYLAGGLYVLGGW